jgi:ubiquinone/menaquinone biosynthesis C-methylase UbiE
MAAQDVVKIAESYYDSREADQFYLNIWGGEDIHIGIYPEAGGPELSGSITEASRKTVEMMAARLEGLDGDTRVLDIGAGYGGSARYLARTAGCRVTCINISETQNQRNRELCEAQGLDDKVSVQYGNFEALPLPADAFDIVWCQDALLHSGNRGLVLEEVRRVLRPGGQWIFTDPMQADDCPPGVLEPVLERIHLATMGSFAFYEKAHHELGFEARSIEDLSEQLPRHYARVRRDLERRYDEIVAVSSAPYVDRMLEGLAHWVDAGDKGYLSWGILHFRLPD